MRLRTLPGLAPLACALAAGCALAAEPGCPPLPGFDVQAGTITRGAECDPYVLTTGADSGRSKALVLWPRPAEGPYRITVEIQRLYAALPKRHAFPGFIVPALKSGETTGQLGAALRHIEDYAASRARERLATALALLEPALLATLTGIVGLIALSFFLPLFSLLGGVNAR